MERCRVNAYCGYRAEEKPISFEVRGRKVVVRRILREWREEDGWFYLLEGEDGFEYLLHYSLKDDIWMVEER